MGQKIKCAKCGDVIESLFRHDMKWCSCGAIFIDGGDDYTRMGGDLEDIIDLQLASTKGNYEEEDDE